MKATDTSIPKAETNGHASAPSNPERIGNAEPEEKIREMAANIELVTVGKARKWLDNAADNRKFSAGHSARLGRSLDATEWRVSNQGVGIDYNGRVIDGQHRLWAVINSGVGAWMVVVRGLDPDTIRAIDETRKRTFADDLRIEGHDQYSMSAAFAGMVLRFEMAAAKDVALSVTRTMQLSRIEQANYLEKYERHCDLTHILRVASRANKSAGLPASATSAAHYLALNRLGDTPEIDEFFGKLADGYNIAPGEPVGALRHGVLARKASAASSKLDPALATAAVLYCLRKSLRGESLTKLQWSSISRQTPRGLLS